MNGSVILHPFGVEDLDDHPIGDGVKPQLKYSWQTHDTHFGGASVLWLLLVVVSDQEATP